MAATMEAQMLDLKSAMQALSLFKTPSEVLSALDADILRRIGEHFRMPDASSKRKQELLKALRPFAEECGMKQLLAYMKRPDLSIICEPLNIDHEDNNPNNRTVLLKRLTEVLFEIGLEDFLKRYTTVETLLHLCKVLSMVPLSKESEALQKQIWTEVNILGLRYIFAQFPVSFLLDCCQDLKLEPPSTQKDVLITVITTQSTAVHVPEVKKKEKKEKPQPSTKKQAIRPGITYDNIFQHYYLEELQQWCKDHELSSSGKKSDIIRRILKFVETDKENAAPVKKDKTKATSSKSKKTKPEKPAEQSSDSESDEPETKVEPKAEPKAEVKSKDSTDTKKDAKKVEEKPEPAEESDSESESSSDDEPEQTPKEAQPAEDSSSDSESEEEPEPLNLAKLEQYKVGELREYCRKANIAIKESDKKDNIIKAIKKANKGSK